MAVAVRVWGKEDEVKKRPLLTYVVGVLEVTLASGPKVLFLSLLSGQNPHDLETTPSRQKDNQNVCLKLRRQTNSLCLCSYVYSF